ncbi:MAG TPA: ATP-binding protein, partial [Vicinamibacterales bacterium]|nr:ATP-binding protein [Vicinamibacterales bacterium]
IATAVSEIARNAFVYAGGGSVDYGVEGAVAPQLLMIRVSDKGPGIARLEDVLSGRYRSRSGMGLGIIGTRRLMDQFDVQSTSKGTTITLKKILPRHSKLVKRQELAALTDRLMRERPAGPIEEVQEQNRELLRALDELRARQEELERVNRELEDTNRGVVALYAELDERADHLRRADELKTRFISNMTHEFRTPVNSILALTGLLAERLHLPADSKDELFYIRKSGQQLSELVDDLLDIAKVEAGKIEVRPAPFEVSALFGALRGMLRPLLVNQALTLTFDVQPDLPPMFSDENKVSQILRNFISNALKYTERGEIIVSARATPKRDAIEFAVADTGIGIPEMDIDRVFEEFVQIDNPLQRGSKGTGLGLPLSKRLAELLGGQISVESTLGVGSTFSVVIPLVHRDGTQTAVTPVQPGKSGVLIVEDSDEDVMIYERAFASTRFQAILARSVPGALTALEVVKPSAIVLDIHLNGDDIWDFLARLKREEATARIPIIVASTVDDKQKGFALGADAYGVKPIDRGWLLETLEGLCPAGGAVRVLSVDDEEAARFIIREMLNDKHFEIIEADSGQEALRRLDETRPDVVLLDLRLTDMTGFDVYDRLRRTSAGARVPVVMVTSQRLTDNDRRRIGDTAVIPKDKLTRDALVSAINAAVGSS